MRRPRQSNSARNTASGIQQHGRRILEYSHDSEPRPQIFAEWLVWLALWPIVMVAWLVAVPFVLGYAAVGFITETLLRIRVRPRNGSDRNNSRR